VSGRGSVVVVIRPSERIARTVKLQIILPICRARLLADISSV
jgi:hypothetical protein